MGPPNGFCFQVWLLFHCKFSNGKTIQLLTQPMIAFITNHSPNTAHPHRSAISLIPPQAMPNDSKGPGGYRCLITISTKRTDPCSTIPPPSHHQLRRQSSSNPAGTRRLMGTKGIGLKTKAPHRPCCVSEVCEWCFLANFRQGGASPRPPGWALHHGDELRRPLLRLLLRGFRLELPRRQLRHLRVQHLQSVSTPLLDKQRVVGILGQGLFIKRGCL